MFSPGPAFVLGFSTVSHLKEMKLLLNFFSPRLSSLHFVNETINIHEKIKSKFKTYVTCSSCHSNINYWMCGNRCLGDNQPASDKKYDNQIT